MNLGMDDWENSSGERPQLLHVGRWAEDLIPESDVLANELYMNSMMADEMVVIPETRPISHDQLVIEVKGIYADLVMVEAKCIDTNEKQTAATQEKDLSKKIQLKNDQWQSLIALHKQLLHEHHDFFLASQHPAASPALSRLAAKYSMPARMWRHGIHTFLEVSRYRLPDSLEHMLAFNHIAYSMMALLFKTVPTFEDTWIECLGDLGRYRMAVEDDEPRDRETWSDVARFWYNKAADRNPTIGRLHHHLAILARPYSLEQLSLYTRALTCVTPFESARGSVMTLFKPILQGTDVVNRRSSSLEIGFIRAHGFLFTPTTRCANYLEDLLSEKASDFEGKGSYTAASATAAIYKHGLLRDELPCRTTQGVNEDTLNRSLDESNPMIAPGKHDRSATKHQLMSTFPHVPGPALDHISYRKMEAPSYGKTWGSFWRFAVRAACKIRSSPTLILTTCTNFIIPITARTIPRDTSNEESGGSFPAAVIPLAHWPELAFVIITLLMAQYLAHIKGPIFIWGCMMTVWAFGWWTIRADPGTTLSISVV